MVEIAVAIVTAFALTFNVLETDERPYWGADDYLFLLRDLRERILVPGGRVALKFQDVASTLPTTIVIDRTGRVAAVVHDAVTE